MMTDAEEADEVAADFADEDELLAYIVVATYELGVVNACVIDLPLAVPSNV